MSIYDCSTLYTTLPHNLIKDKLIDLIERTFQREGSPYLACYDGGVFFTSEKPKKYHAWSCQNVCDTLTFLLDTYRYLNDILNINNVYFDNMVSQIYSSTLQLNKANTSDTQVAFLDLHLSISSDIVYQNL